MAVKVGNSWVSEAAYAYARSKVSENTCAEDKTENSMLNQLSEKYPDINFNTSRTEPRSNPLALSYMPTEASADGAYPKAEEIQDAADMPWIKTKKTAG